MLLNCDVMIFIIMYNIVHACKRGQCDEIIFWFLNDIDSEVTCDNERSRAATMAYLQEYLMVGVEKRIGF